MSGDLNFTGGFNSTAKVVNKGTINVAENGFVVLAAATVDNQGTINAPNGDVSLVSAPEFTLLTQDGTILKLDLPNSVLANADNAPEPFKGIVNNSGVINARSVGENTRGEVVLYAAQGNIKTSDNSVILGTDDGTTLQAGGRIDHDGQIIQFSGADINIISNGNTFLGEKSLVQAFQGGNINFRVGDLLKAQGTIDASNNIDILANNFVSQFPATVKAGQSIRLAPLSDDRNTLIGSFNLGDNALQIDPTELDILTAPDVTIGRKDTLASTNVTIDGDINLVNLGYNLDVISGGDIISQGNSFTLGNHTLDLIACDDVTIGGSGDSLNVTSITADDDVTINAPRSEDAPNTFTVNAANIAGNTVNVSAPNNLVINTDITGGDDIKLLANQDGLFFGDLTLNGTTYAKNKGGDIRLEGINILINGDTISNCGTVTIANNGANEGGLIQGDRIDSPDGEFRETDFFQVNDDGSFSFLNVERAALPLVANGSTPGTNGSAVQRQGSKLSGETLDLTIGGGGGDFNNADFRFIEGSSQGDIRFLDRDGFTFNNFTMADTAGMTAVSFVPDVTANNNKVEDRILVSGTVSGAHGVRLETSIRTPDEGVTNNGIDIAGTLQAKRDIVLEVNETTTGIRVLEDGLVETTGGDEVFKNIRFQADSISIDGTVNSGISGETPLLQNNQVVLAPTTDGLSIGVGGGDGTLQLTQNDFNNINTRDVFVGQTSTTGTITIDLLDLSAKTNTDLTLNTLGTIVEQTPTADPAFNLVLATDRNLFLTGSASKFTTFDRFSTLIPGPSGVGAPGVLGDIDVFFSGTGAAFATSGGANATATTLDNTPANVFVNVVAPGVPALPTPITFRNFGDQIPVRQQITIQDDVNGVTRTFGGDFEVQTDFLGTPNNGLTPGIGVPSL